MYYDDEENAEGGTCPACGGLLAYDPNEGTYCLDCPYPDEGAWYATSQQEADEFNARQQSTIQ